MYRDTKIATHSAGYGEMPLEMLIAKSESTYMPDSTYMYEDHARETLTDWTPDKNKFEHEEPRGGVTARSGALNLRLNGHRGTAETAYRPEYFDGFHGEEDRDPRGINPDPDMRKMKQQAAARSRFYRFSADDCHQITGGVRAEAREIKDQQTLMKIVRERLKVFTRALDGRREGLRRFFSHKSAADKQVVVQSYGDYIKDYALNPQRRAVIITGQILRDSRAFRQETSDAEFAVAKYSQLCRRGGKESGRAPRSRESDVTYGSSDGTKHYTAAAMLMSSIVKRRAQAVKSFGDGEKAESAQTVARTTAPFVRDLTEILRAVGHDATAGESDETRGGKMAPLVRAEHLANVTTRDGLTSAHTNLAADMIFKQIFHTGDGRKNADKSITDSTHVGVRETLTAGGKQARRRILTGANLATTGDADTTDGSRTFNYRTLPSQKKRRTLHAGDIDYKDAGDAHVGKELHQVQHGHVVGKSTDDMRYSDNTQKDRRGGRVGGKYLRREMTRDERGEHMDDF
jgi:hypothetical protein